MFKEFFKPKWQHRNPEVRKQAIELLDARQDQETLLEIARQDSEPSLRCLAVRKLSDLRVLREISQKLGNWEVTQLAGQRFQQLLAGLKDDAPPLQARLDWIGELDDAELIAYLARQAKEAELRLAAVRKIDQQNLLGEIAMNDGNAQVCLAATEKLSNENLLEQVAKASRNRDKRVYRLASERLAALVEARERPLRLRAQREELCKRMEWLNKAEDWEKGKAEADRLAGLWQAVEGEAEADQAERFAALQAQFQSAWRDWQARQEILISLRAEKKALCESLTGLLAELDSEQSLDAGQSQGVTQELATLESRWAQIDSLGGAAEAEFQACFNNARCQARERQQELEAFYRIAGQMRAVCEEAERLLTATARPLDKAVLEKLNRRWEAVDKPAQPNDLISELQARFDSTRRLLEERLDKQREEQKQREKTLKTTLRELDEALAAGELQKARTLESAARDLLRQLGHLPKPRRAPLEHQLQAAGNKIRDLRGWQHWGNTLEREQLCQRAEALVGAEGDPEDIARRIREAQEEWKKLSQGDESGHALWQRFHKACQAAYAPCQAHFQAQAAERQAHLAHKEALCAHLETLAAETDWNALSGADTWHQMYQQVQGWRHEFLRSGPVDRKQQKAVGRRFDQAWAVLEEYFERERKRNYQRRMELVKRAQALAEQADPRKATDEAKSLQQAWKISIPASRKEERELWREFRAACDAVFARRQAERQAQDDEREANLAAKNALCDSLEQLAQEADAAPLPARLHKLQGEWAQIGPVPKKAMAALDKRFHHACQAVEKRHAAWRASEAARQESLMLDKAGLCTRRENGEALEGDLQAAWTALPPLADTALENRLAARFAKAGPTPDEQDLRLLCIRMELLAGIESPPEDTQTRMAYQVERLSKAMGGDKPAHTPAREAEELFRAWCLCGPVAESDPWFQRFMQARRALTSG